MDKLKINCPPGHEIDLDKSDLSQGVVYFKKSKKVLTYQDIAKKLLNTKRGYFITNIGTVEMSDYIGNHCQEPNASTTKEQLDSILNLNKLCNVAKYLNGDWRPTSKPDTSQYHIIINDQGKVMPFWGVRIIIGGVVYFKSKASAEKAIEILGEDIIKSALTLNH